MDIDEQTKLAMLESQARYTRDRRFQMLCQSAVSAAIDEHGPIDPDRADKGAYYIALRAVTVALHRAFDENAELKHQIELAEHYRTLAERTIAMTPPRILTTPIS